MFLSLLNDHRQVSASAILHEDIKSASILVNIAIMIFNDMVVVKLFENVSTETSLRIGKKLSVCRQSSHFGDNLLFIPFLHLVEFQFLPGENLGSLVSK